MRSLQEIVAVPPSSSPQAIFYDGGKWEERKVNFVSFSISWWKAVLICLSLVEADSYVPGREIISRKYTQFNEIKPATAKEYINELARKYPPGAKIADVPTQRKGSGHQNDGLRTQEDITGVMILEVPVQKGKVPKEILDHATKKDVVIRDENGKILNLP
ncbi:hypothetical protein [Kroppenstedtia sanguinis]|uniref:Uncharacterized protein n=1 Tax=Kroppenstedtia sanguinis TaxID=1380684 RepID=A0ABW4CCB2_9BACL